MNYDFKYIVKASLTGKAQVIADFGQAFITVGAALVNLARHITDADQ